jgi:hypothetical protein
LLSPRVSFCSSGRRTIETVTSTPSGWCAVHNHDFVSDGFLAVIAPSLVLFCSGCSLSHLANLSRRALTFHRPHISGMVAPCESWVGRIRTKRTKLQAAMFSRLDGPMCHLYWVTTKQVAIAPGLSVEKPRFARTEWSVAQIITHWRPSKKSQWRSTIRHAEECARKRVAIGEYLVDYSGKILGLV